MVVAQLLCWCCNCFVDAATAVVVLDIVVTVISIIVFVPVAVSAAISGVIAAIPTCHIAVANFPLFTITIAIIITIHLICNLCCGCNSLAITSIVHFLSCSAVVTKLLSSANTPDLIFFSSHRHPSPAVRCKNSKTIWPTLWMCSTSSSWTC
jgi:hypothetical protein